MAEAEEKSAFLSQAGGLAESPRTDSMSKGQRKSPLMDRKKLMTLDWVGEAKQRPKHHQINQLLLRGRSRQM